MVGWFFNFNTLKILYETTKTKKVVCERGKNRWKKKRLASFVVVWQKCSWIYYYHSKKNVLFDYDFVETIAQEPRRHSGQIPK
jgi:hypothetical protein